MPRWVRENHLIIQVRFPDGSPARYVALDNGRVVSKARSGQAELYSSDARMRRHAVTAQSKFAPCHVYIHDLLTGKSRLLQSKHSE